LNSVNGVNAYTPDQIVAMVGHATGLSSDESRNFMSSILLNPMVKTAGKCVEEYSAFALSQCTGWVTANEQWKQQGAMSGTSFLKT
jgi:SH3-like domain-containing protein